MVTQIDFFPNWSLSLIPWANMANPSCCSMKPQSISEMKIRTAHTLLVRLPAYTHCTWNWMALFCGVIILHKCGALSSQTRGSARENRSPPHCVAWHSTPRRIWQDLALFSRGQDICPAGTWYSSGTRGSLVWNLWFVCVVDIPAKRQDDIWLCSGSPRVPCQDLMSEKKGWAFYRC